MQNILRLVKHHIKMFFRDSWGIALLVLPIVVSVISLKIFDVESLSIQGTIAIYGAEQNQAIISKISERLQEENIAVSLFYGQKSEMGLVEKGELDVEWMVPDTNFLEDLAKEQITLKIIGKEEPRSKVVRGTLQGIIEEIQVLAKLSKGDIEEFNTLYQQLQKEVQNTVITQGGGAYLANKQAFGIFAMLLMMTGGYGLRIMAREKESRIYARIKMTPIKRYEYILGHVGGSLSLLSLQVVIEWLVLEGLNINFNLSMGMFLAIGLTLMLISVGIGLLLVSVSSNTSVFGMMLGLVMPPLAMLSDCIFPIEFLPEWVDQVSHLSPIRWVMEGYNVALAHADIGKVAGNLGIASMIAIILILLSIVVENKKNVGVR